MADRRLPPDECSAILEILNASGKPLPDAVFKCYVAKPGPHGRGAILRIRYLPGQARMPEGTILTIVGKPQKTLRYETFVLVDCRPGAAQLPYHFILCQLLNCEYDDLHDQFVVSA